MKIKTRSGFTLIEMLVVMAILGILIALLLPNMMRAIRRGQETECLSNIRAINTACAMCFSELRDWDSCDSLDEIAPYFPQGNAPTCPFDITYEITQDTTSGGYMVNDSTHYPNGMDQPHAEEGAAE